MIDNFDAPLLQAASFGYINDALNLYKLLFPRELCRAKNIYKIVVMSTCHVDIPGCLTNDKSVDPSLLRTTIQSQSKR